MEDKVVFGVIGGSGLLKSTMIKSIAKEELIVDTAFGKVRTFVGDLSNKVTLVFVQRHGCDPEREYSPPHLVNYQAMLLALQKLNVAGVVAVCSVGSMQMHIGMGSLLVPDDYFCFYNILSTVEDHRAHCMPEINPVIRNEVLNALFNAGMRPLDGGVYVNSRGPRFETKAEIRFMSQCGDVVGMTAAHEATIAKELNIPYAMLAIVDNMANGIGPKLSIEAFYREQAKNKPKIEQAVHLVLKHFAAYPEVLASLRDGTHPSLLEHKANAVQAKEKCDTLIHARYVLTVDEKDTVLEHHAVAVLDGKILEVLPSNQAEEKYGMFSTETLKVIRLPEAALMPGLVNAHTHAPMVFMRGFGDDMELGKWLTQKIWPAEVRCVSDEFVRDGTRLACAEFIQGGTTCYSDMYFYGQAAAEIAEQVGIRAFIGGVLLEFPSNYAKDAEEYISKAKELFALQAKDSALVRFTVAPHSTYAVSEMHLKEAYALAEQFNLPFHIHLHETEKEVKDSEAGDRTSQFCHNCEHACRPMKNLVDIGCVSERLVAAHMCHLTDEEIATLAAKGASIVHCPTSNLKLASGFCRVADLLKAGVNVCLGTDGASSNNSLDMFAEMKLAAILAKGVSKNPESLPAEQAIRMATINGAKALGVGDICGSLEVGKSADIIAVDLSDISSVPTYSVASHIVYATGRQQVSHVWVAGQSLLENRVLQTIDVSKLHYSADKWCEKVSSVDQNHDGSYK